MTRNRFRKEITMVIILKLIALILLWKFFIPSIDSMQLTKSKLAEHFISMEKYS